MQQLLCCLLLRGPLLQGSVQPVMRYLVRSGRPLAWRLELHQTHQSHDRCRHELRPNQDRLPWQPAPA